MVADVLHGFLSKREVHEEEQGGENKDDAERWTGRDYDFGHRESNRKAQKQRAAEASVMRTYQGSVASRGPSATARQICANVSRPKTTPVVMT
jgi:hypothetical protein